MAISESRVINGVVRAAWDDAAETYTEYGADGVTVTLTRAYTAVELAIKAGRVAQATAGTNSTTLRSQAQAAIDELLADRTGLQGVAAVTNAAILAAPGPYVKGVAAALDRSDKRLVQVIRLVSGLLSTTDSG